VPLESAAPDGTPVSSNYVWWSGSASSLNISWKATNSQTSDLIGLAAHIDARVAITNYGLTARTVADHFPAYEAYQYPRYTVNGVRAGYPLFTCNQFQIDGLYDSPWERRTCG